MPIHCFGDEPWQQEALAPSSGPGQRRASAVREKLPQGTAATVAVSGSQEHYYVCPSGTSRYFFMKPYPSTPQLKDAPESLLSRGHLWLREHIAGPRVRFMMESSGRLVFGSREQVFDDVPPPYEHTVRHIREQFDRNAFHGAVEDPSAYVFFGVASCHVGVAYDWDRMPSFLGYTIWNGAKERFLPLDTAEQVFERLNLAPVNAFQKEVNVRDFHPERFEMPDSEWYDGPAAGIRIENRSGGSALMNTGAINEQRVDEPLDDDPRVVANELVTDGRIARAIEAIETSGKPVTTADVHARVFELLVREEYIRLDQSRIDLEAVRSAVRPVVAKELS